VLGGSSYLSADVKRALPSGDLLQIWQVSDFQAIALLSTDLKPNRKDAMLLLRH
jgi:hypothetical protein